jgi:hypothetical protein
VPAGPAPQSPQGPLSAEHYAQFEAAQRRGKKLRGVSRFAIISGSISAVITVISLFITALSSMIEGLSVVGLLVCAALLIVTINEFRGAARVRRIDPGAPTLLAFNQLFLLGAITAYCVWSMLTPSSLTSSSSAAELDQVLPGVSEHAAAAAQAGNIVIYGAVIAGSVMTQGLAALYYFLHRRTMREYIRQTPPWIIQLQRRGQ